MRRWPTWAALPTLATPFAIPQRATLVQLAASLFVDRVGDDADQWLGPDQRSATPARAGRGRGSCGSAAWPVASLFRLLSRVLPSPGTTRQTFASENQAQSAQARRDAFSRRRR